MPGSPKTDSTGKGLSVFIYAKRYIMRKNSEESGNIKKLRKDKIRSFFICIIFYKSSARMKCSSLMSKSSPYMGP